MTKEELLEMPNWPQAVMPQIVENLECLARISSEIAADKVEGPRLAEFVNKIDPFWARLVEASKTVKPAEALQVEKVAETTQAQPERSLQGTPEAKAADIIEPHITTKASIVDIIPKAESTNETQPQPETTSLRPHIKKMAGN